ncbi:hypothetical protein FKW77_003210 [Venturia effusa]|uniref:Uncharacterized protein n=1 Tax=Venturia effusa TaxID=50376 RepID=A0A517L106_9PEZI|nr:hypothetical protein FKW77_003210 [Venturia effusa]
MTITVQDALKSNLPLNFMPVQGSSAKTKERRKKFPDISSQSLSVLSGNSHTLQYDRFTLSPISPSHLSDQSSPELDTNPLRRSLLERYLIEDTHPVIRTSTGKYTLTLAGTGLSDALVTPSPDNMFVRIETNEPKVVAKPAQPPPRSDSPKAKWVMPAGSHERAHSGTRLSTKENMSARKQSGRISIHTQRRMKLTMLMDAKQTRGGPRFTRDDSGLMTPPPSRFEKSFADQMPEVAISTKPSPFDPPPAPSQTTFPGYFPSSPKTSGPAPIDTSLRIFRKKDRESFMNSPILPEDRARAVQRAMYPPPAPTSGCFPEEFPQSPARSGPAPIDTAITSPNSTWSMVSTPPVLSPMAPPPPAPTSGQFPQSATRRVSVSNKKDLKFDAPYSPSLSQLKSSASPLTPLALFCTFPAIEGIASPVPAGAFSGIAEGIEEEPQTVKDDAELTTAIERGRSSARDSLQTRHRARTLSAPRTTSDSLLPDKELDVLPSTRYDPTVIYDAPTNTRTVVYPIPMLFSTKSSYTVANITDSDRNRILRSYFRRGRSSTAQS